MALSGTDFQCIILNRGAQKNLHGLLAKSALSRKTQVGVWLNGSGLLQHIRLQKSLIRSRLDLRKLRALFGLMAKVT